MAKATEHIERQKRLDQAVENYAIRPKVDIDSERVKKDTQARMIRRETELDKADAVKLFNNHGFTIDNLMKDIRYKVNAALSEAGLQNTSYGQ